MKEIFPEEVCVITALDKEIPKILETILPYLPQQEKVCYQDVNAELINGNHNASISSKIMHFCVTHES